MSIETASVIPPSRIATLVRDRTWRIASTVLRPLLNPYCRSCRPGSFFSRSWTTLPAIIRSKNLPPSSNRQIDRYSEGASDDLSSFRRRTNCALLHTEGKTPRLRQSMNNRQSVAHHLGPLRLGRGYRLCWASPCEPTSS